MVWNVLKYVKNCIYPISVEYLGLDLGALNGNSPLSKICFLEKLTVMKISFKYFSGIRMGNVYKHNSNF